MGEGRTSDTPKSKYLIFHCHGGGWVAQSSFSHEFYLREWAYKLDVPIFSIDYSLVVKYKFNNKHILMNSNFRLQKHHFPGDSKTSFTLIAGL